MQPVIRRERPAGVEIEALIAERLAQSADTSPPESNHALGIGELNQSSVVFLTARVGQALVGCGAYVPMDAATAEVKSMFVRPAFRGQGIARTILARLETDAVAEGIRAFYLETGTDSFAARHLYEASGFSYVDPFADYQPDPYSVFMCKQLG